MAKLLELSKIHQCSAAWVLNHMYTCSLFEMRILKNGIVLKECHPPDLTVETEQSRVAQIVDSIGQHLSLLTSTCVLSSVALANTTKCCPLTIQNLLKCPKLNDPAVIYLR